MKSLKGSALCFGWLCVALLLVACQAAPMPAPTPTPVQPPPTAAPDLVAPVEAWVDAINKGDVDAALDLLADNALWSARYALDMDPYKSGGKQVRRDFDYLVGMEAKSQVKNCQPQDDRVVCEWSLVDGCMVAFGAPDGLAGRLVFIYQPDGKVREVELTLDDPRLGDYTKFGIRSDAWAIDNRGEEHVKINPRQSRLGGSLEAKFCKEYAESLEAAPPIPASDLVAPLKAYVDALNSGDVDGALALFADNAKWADGTVRAVGKEQMRPMLEWLVAQEVKQQITYCQPQSDRVACRLSRAGPCYPVPSDASGLSVKSVFIYGPDGKVKQAETGSAGPSWDYVGKWWLDFNAWVFANHPDGWEKAQDETKEGGLISARLCKEYAETLQ